jgi:bifunctional non-homologous end joining protein LigD
VHLWSRNENDFGTPFPSIADALASLPEGTVIDGEIVALDDKGKPSFNALQNYGSSKAPLIYYLFDVPVLSGRDLRDLPLEDRRARLEQTAGAKLVCHHRCMLLKMGEAGTRPNAPVTRILVRHLINRHP